MAPPFLSSALDGGEWSASRIGQFIPAETAPGLDFMEKTLLHPAGNEPRLFGREARSVVARPTELPRLRHNSFRTVKCRRMG
jgi:hypothetical protein